MLIDSHCHLDDERLYPDIEGVLNRAKQTGIRGFLSIAARFEEFKSVLDLAEKYNTIWASLGIHPAEAGKQNPDFDTLFPFYQNPKVLGVGECGFDFYYADKVTDFNRQRDLFLTQIHLAQKLQKPLIIHTRDAEEETESLLVSEYKKHPFQAVLHCYTGSWDFAKKMLDIGFYVSASGVITFKKSEALREVFKHVPLDRLLVETDAPYLSPEPHRGKICEPAYMADTARFLASMRGLSFEDLAHTTTQNFKTLFKPNGLNNEI